MLRCFGDAGEGREACVPLMVGWVSSDDILVAVEWAVMEKGGRVDGDDDSEARTANKRGLRA